MVINDRIKEMIRSEKGFTQKGLADNIGVASSTVNNWLKLGRSIPAEYIIPICEYLNVSSEFLLTGENLSSYSHSNEDNEWLTLIHQLPPETQAEFRGEIKGYLKRLNEESVAADQIKQAK